MPTPTAPGRFIYIDPIGSPPEPVELVLDGEDLCAQFLEAEAQAELICVRDMAGEFRPA